jgi:DNA-directed RNA polymerase subunit RPC12/RpoP
MKYCRKCGRPISSKAINCPSCGHPTGVIGKPPAPKKDYEDDEQLSGWWVGLFFGWKGVFILMLTNRKKDAGSRRSVSGAILAASIVSIVLIVLLIIIIIISFSQAIKLL